MATMTRRKTDQSVATQHRARTVSSHPHHHPQQQPQLSSSSSSSRSKRPLDDTSSDHATLRSKRAKVTLSSDPTPVMEAPAVGPIATAANKHNKLAPPPLFAPDAPAQRTHHPRQPQHPPSSRKTHYEPISVIRTASRPVGTTTNAPSAYSPSPGRNTSRPAASPNNGLYTDVSLAPIDPHTVQTPAPVPRVKSTKPKSATAAPSSPSKQPFTTALTASTATSKPNPVVTKHRAKVINGIRHELDRLQPADADRKLEETGGRRKLRSTENTRLKSDLSTYFPEYDQVIGNDPKEESVLDIDTPIVLIDSHPLPKTAKSQPQAPLNFADHLASSFNGVHAQVVDLSVLDKRVVGDVGGDPLADGVYEALHKRQERNEKLIRNIEKSKAQHEKERVERLLASLQGQDWLRVLGIHGITTEARKKQYRPARQYFIKGCENILAKFKEWSEYEKGKRNDKGRSKSRTSTPPGGPGSKRGGDGAKDPRRAKRQRRSATRNSPVPDADDSDIDASVAKQLQEESAARSHVHSGKARVSTGSKAPQHKEPAEPPKPQEFTSFFDKAYQREAALQGRRTRHPLAWGRPVPEMEEKEFSLPADLLDAEAIKALGRRRRQARRERRDALAAQSGK